MNGCALRPDPENGFTQIVGVGGIGTGIIFAIKGDQTLGRNESRLGRALDARDYCKLHIVEHYIAALLGAGRPESVFRIFAVGNVGADQQGKALIEEIRRAGIDTHHLNIETGFPTLFSVSLLYPDKSGCNITSSNSAASTLRFEQLELSRNDLEAAGTHGVALCLPEIPLGTRRRFLQIATESHSYRVASFASGEMREARQTGLLSQVDLLAMNLEEASALVESRHPGVDTCLMSTCSRIAVRANPKMKLLLSAGADGAYTFENGTWAHHSSFPADVVSTAGAGDALLAGVLSGMAAGLPLTGGTETRPHPNNPFETAAELGILLAGFSITSQHSIHPDAGLDTLLAFRRRAGNGAQPVPTNPPDSDGRE